MKNENLLATTTTTKTNSFYNNDQ